MRATLTQSPAAHSTSSASAAMAAEATNGSDSDASDSDASASLGEFADAQCMPRWGKMGADGVVVEVAPPTLQTTPAMDKTMVGASGERVPLRTWPCPTAAGVTRKRGGRGDRDLGTQALNESEYVKTALPGEQGGAVSPAFLEDLMRVPRGYTDPFATIKSQFEVPDPDLRQQMFNMFCGAVAGEVTALRPYFRTKGLCESLPWNQRLLQAHLDGGHIDKGATLVRCVEDLKGVDLEGCAMVTLTFPCKSASSSKAWRGA